MPPTLLAAENLRLFLPSLLEPIAQKIEENPLSHATLILTETTENSTDLNQLLLRSQRPDGIIATNAVQTFSHWIQSQLEILDSRTFFLPRWMRKILFFSIVQKQAQPLNYPQELFFQNLFQSLEQAHQEHIELHDWISLLPRAVQTQLSPFLGLLKTYKAYFDSPYPYVDSYSANRKLTQALTQNKLTSLKTLKAIYWIGFTQQTQPALKILNLINQHFPHVEQLWISQKPTNRDFQDWLTTHPTHFSENSLELITPVNVSSENKALQFSHPFEEAAYILEQIQQQLAKDVLTPIGLFLPQQPFWQTYFLRQLKVMGIESSFNSRPLKSFINLRNTLAQTPESILEKIDRYLSDKQALNADFFSNEERFEIQAFEQWKKLIKEAQFYQELFQSEEILSFDFAEILSQQSFSTHTKNTSGLVLRHHHNPGFLSFATSYVFSCLEDYFQFEKQLLPQAFTSLASHCFQNLFYSSSQTNFTYSTTDCIGKETLASSFLSEFNIDLQIKQGSKHFLFLTHEAFTPTDQEKKKVFEKERLIGKAFELKSEVLKKELKQHYQNHVYTAQALENYAQCPLQFFLADFFKIKSEIELTPEGSASERGKWIHQFLELYFGRYHSEIGQAFFNLALRENLIEQLDELLKIFSHQLLQEESQIDSLFLEDFLSELKKVTKKLLEECWQHNNKENIFFIPAYFEKTFGTDQQPWQLKWQDQTLALKGRVDRIDFSNNHQYAVVLDYKTGETSRLSSQIKNFKSFQLPIYLKATEKILNQNSNATNHQQVIGALALSLKEMQTPQGLIQKSWASTFGIRTNAGAVLAEDGWDDYWNTFLKNLFQIKENIERLSFQALPDPCNPYCASRTICRHHEKN